MKINTFVQSFFHRSLTFYNLIYNEALLTPSTHQKISCRTLEGEKNILQAHTPRKKIHGELRGWKKISCLYQITQPPLQKLNGWPLSNCCSVEDFSCTASTNYQLAERWFYEVVVTCLLFYSNLLKTSKQLAWLCISEYIHSTHHTEGNKMSVSRVSSWQ